MTPQMRPSRGRSVRATKGRSAGRLMPSTRNSHTAIRFCQHCVIVQVTPELRAPHVGRQLRARGRQLVQRPVGGQRLLNAPRQYLEAGLMHF